MNRGYVKLWRKSKDSGFLGNAEAWQLLCWCLMSASHKRHKLLVGKQLVTLEPGQLVFGRKAAAQELNTTEQRIRTSLKLLENGDFLTSQPTNKYSIITIVNWHSYQDEQSVSNQQPNQQATSKNDGFSEKDEKINQPANQQIERNNLTVATDYGEQQPANNQQANQPATSNQPTSNHKQTHKAHKKDKDIKTPCQVFGEDSEPYRLAVFMRDTLKANLPTLKEPNLQKWASAFDVAIRNDERMIDVRFTAQVIKWACSDDFWKANIQSPGKLREKFDQLTAKMESVRGSRASPSPRVGMSAHGNTKAGWQERNYGQSVIPDWAAGGEENDAGK